MAQTRPKGTTDPAKALGHKITMLERRIRELELRPDPDGGSGDLTYVPITLFPSCTNVGAFGNPAAAIDRGVIHISGAVGLGNAPTANFQNGSFFGYLDTTLYPEIDEHWPPITGTRRFGGFAADRGATTPLDIRPCVGLMSNTGDGKLRFGCFIHGINSAAVVTATTLFTDVVVRLAPPAASP